MPLLSMAALIGLASSAASGLPPTTAGEILESRPMVFGLTEQPVTLASSYAVPESSLRLTNPATVAPFAGGLDLIHPRTMFSLTVSAGTEELTFNTNDPTNVPPDPGGDGDAVFFGVRGEHFWPNQLGVFLSGDFGSVDNMKHTFDGGGGPDQIEDDVETTLLFLALSYRATVDDDFRMPVRVGPYYHQAKLTTEDLGPNTPGTAKIDYSTIGVKLVAEPEYIIMQRIQGERMSELTVFLEVGVGCGPTEVESKGAGGVKEKGNAFSFGAELGARYKFFNGVFVGASVINRKQYYGSTDSYDNGVVFFGSEDDYLGFGLTVGGRF